ncbi:efflux RND transporter periplasmic adaptor subunit [Pseudomonas sp. OIL-1]|uniref:efflux RND transporter periplasmic adaptor subunit n=1 Tax=Pseudomonas sp. OIL-1 TaxID=2706126 RepID=UPI0013A78CE6|nr:efflux RND transporter periplasmic adaptor subunit [Pseudomonas sp. OIL-1]QIB52556.1 efflux RND transporter periplasmic adaptor subunit [Pseudomonas sp. OIL-1]
MNTSSQVLPRLIRILLPGLAVLSLSGCGNDGGVAAAEQSSPVPVRVAEVVKPQATEPLHFAGAVRARQRASLTFQVGGVLSERTAELGQAVEAGQVLASLYNPELEPARDAALARIRELEAQASQARRDLQRTEQLYEKGVVSANEREQQRARLEALRAGVSNAKAAAARTERLQEESQLRAPFAGQIEAVLVEPGEFVAPGQPTFRLAAAGGMEVEVRVPASLLREMQVGQTLPVRNALTGAQLAGHVVEIGRSASGASALYPLVISLDHADLQSGDAVEVGLQRPGGEALAVPLAAIMRSADGLAVFRVNDGQVRRVPVEVESVRGELAMLGSDTLAAGDQVVYAGLTRLADNDRVELLP